MHNFLCTSLVALIGACSLPALASIEGHGTQRIEITAPRAALAAAQAVLAQRGEDSLYETSNGRNVVITSFANHVEMRYGRRAAQQLRHDGQGNFVSRDGSVTLQFDVDAHGQANLLRLSAPASWF